MTTQFQTDAARALAATDETNAIADAVPVEGKPYPHLEPAPSPMTEMMELLRSIDTRLARLEAKFGG